MSEAHDVVVIGGGVAGLSSALALGRRGAKVLLLERGTPGGEASTAAAGILGAQVEALAPGHEAELLVASREMYPAFAAGLLDATGVDVGYRRCGVLKVARGAEAAEALRRQGGWQAEAGLRVEERSGARLAELLPGLGAGFEAGAWFADDAQVDPVALVGALVGAAEASGVQVRAGVQVRRVALEGSRARGVVLEDGTVVAAAHVVLAAGSWSSLIENVPLEPGQVRPARGQIVELRCRRRPFAPVLYGPGAYLVPRPDGRVLVGSTLEFVGYHKDVTARGVRDLLAAATALWPALEEASLGRCWSGLRPHAAAPLLGLSPLRGLVLATGHHRNGILLAPLTGEIVAAACEGRSYELPAKS